MGDYDNKRHIGRILEGFIEIALLALLYYLVFGFYRPEFGEATFAYKGKYVLMGVYAAIVFIVFKMCDSFNFGNLKLIDITISQWISMVIVNLVTYFQLCLIANKMISVVPMLLLTVADFILTFICSYIFTAIYHKTYVPRNMVLIYGNEEAKSIEEKLEKRSDKYLITSTISSKAPMDEITKEIDAHNSVIINDVPVERRNDIVKYCYAKSIRTYLVPKISDVIIKGAEDLTLFDTPLSLVTGKGPSETELFVKRLFDILLSGIALIPASIVMLIIAIAIKIEDGGPVLYRQKRVTLNDREFDMLKFRSMIPDAEKYTGVVLAEENDPRITKVGRFIRKCRLDELPQLLNILKGDMSVVGPRPERRALIEEYIKAMPEFAFRTKVKGGLTGYSQVYGKYNTTPYDKLKMDLMYIENYSLLLDIKVMFMTLQILFRKESTEGVERK